MFKTILAILGYISNVFATFKKPLTPMGGNNKEALERSVMTYLPHLYFKLFIAEAHSNSNGKSEHGKMVFRDRYKNMPEHERQALLKLYDEMTPEQRKNPKK